MEVFPDTPQEGERDEALARLQGKLEARVERMQDPAAVQAVRDAFARTPRRIPPEALGLAASTGLWELPSLDLDDLPTLVGADEAEQHQVANTPTAEIATTGG